jgi:hypothetical protein
MSVKAQSEPQADVIEDVTQDAQISGEPTPDLESSPIPSSDAPLQHPRRWSSKLSTLSRQISRLHGQTPLLKRFPPYVIFPITLLMLVNCIVWAIVGIILRHYPYSASLHAFNDRTLVSPAALAYTFGLRHALDADHIAAIDNVQISPLSYMLIIGLQEACSVRPNARYRWDFLQVSCLSAQLIAALAIRPSS